MKFSDIEKFTRSGSWECDYPFYMLDDAIKEWETKHRLELNPDFQRGHVWSEKQQIAYIEYFLRGGKSARVVYLNCPWWASGDQEDYDMPMVCVDGLQRITALRKFANNEIKAFDCFYKDYEDTPRSTYCNIKINVNDLKTKEDVLTWYLEMNTGGVVHSEEEINRVKKMLVEERKRK